MAKVYFGGTPSFNPAMRKLRDIDKEINRRKLLKDAAMATPARAVEKVAAPKDEKRRQMMDRMRDRLAEHNASEKEADRAKWVEYGE